MSLWEADQDLAEARKDHAAALGEFCEITGWSQRQAESLLALIDAQRVLNHAEVAHNMAVRECIEEGYDGGWR
jgi:hypothetical protein